MPFEVDGFDMLRIIEFNSAIVGCFIDQFFLSCFLPVSVEFSESQCQLSLVRRSGMTSESSAEQIHEKILNEYLKIY